MSDPSKLNNLSYEITFNVPSYNIEEANQVIDMILVTNDTDQFHKYNYIHNYSHYSGLSKRLPLPITA